MLINSLAPTHTPTLEPQRAPLRDATRERVEILLLNHELLYSLVFSGSIPPSHILFTSCPATIVSSSSTVVHPNLKAWLKQFVTFKSAEV